MDSFDDILDDVIGDNDAFEKVSMDFVKEAHSFLTKISTDQKKQETALYNKWKQTGNKKHFQDLYVSMKPLISKAISSAAYNSNIPQSAHMAYAAQNFYDSLRTYNPSKGALQTHVYGSVGKKANRLNALYQNLGHMPEPRAQMVGKFLDAKEFLKNQLDREASAAEVADHMRVGLKQVALLETEVQKDLALDEGTEQHAYFMTDKDEEKLEFLYYDLNGEEQVVYDYIMGAHGKPRMLKSGGKKIDYDRIAKSMGVSTSKVRNLHKKITAKLERMK